MSITLFQKESGCLYGEVRQDKGCKTYVAIICSHGHEIYKNYFSTIENAKKAINRNWKKYK